MSQLNQGASTDVLYYLTTKPQLLHRFLNIFKQVAIHNTVQLLLQCLGKQISLNSNFFPKTMVLVCFGVTRLHKPGDYNLFFRPTLQVSNSFKLQTNDVILQVYPMT